MVAYETYANALITKGHGHPLWEPDPGEYAPVDLGDVGYLYRGAFIKLFNVSKDVHDWSNRLGLPHGHTLLHIGDILRPTPLPKAPEHISSEGVSEKGGDFNVTTG
jgi:peptidoglycan/xylan/chitin deacetylase (PgdA/CDA1 family)